MVARAILHFCVFWDCIKNLLGSNNGYCFNALNGIDDAVPLAHCPVKVPTNLLVEKLTVPFNVVIEPLFIVALTTGVLYVP